MYVKSSKSGDGDSVVVISTSYEKALDEAKEERRDTREPISIEIVDPDFERVLRIIVKGAKTAVKIGARETGKLTKLGIKYGYAGAKVLGKEAAHAVAKSYREMRVRRLIDEAYSLDRNTRILARAQLKTRYPEIYAICDFS